MNSSFLEVGSLNVLHLSIVIISRYCFPQAATSSPTTSVHTEVITGPFQQIQPGREESSPSTSSAPLRHFDQGLEISNNVSPGFLLALPTLDDFIPPHLQKTPNHQHPLFSPQTVLHTHAKLPSLSSPPPLLIPPATETSSSILATESTGMVFQTVSLIAPMLSLLLNKYTQVEITFHWQTKPGLWHFLIVA